MCHLKATSISYRLLIPVLLINLSVIAKCERIYPGNPYSHREILDEEGKFLLEWIAHPKSSEIIFNITAETKGYVAIGFSKTGKMLKSDIVIGGVRKNRRTYLSDRYTTSKDRYPKQDLEQSWKLLDSWENKTHTSIKIMRQRDTCDPHDFPITEDLIHLIWAYGEEDVLDYHFKNRGSQQMHLLQPDLTPEVLAPSGSSQQIIAMPSIPSPSTSRSPPTTNETRLDVWRLTVTVENPPNGDPWCVFQQGPELRKRHNIIGFSTVPSDEQGRMNVDRLVVYKCSPTEKDKRNSRNAEETSKKFERFLDYSGPCKNATDLYLFCDRIIYTWGKGGKDTFLPKNLGVPFGGKDEYYLLESFFIPQPFNETANQNGGNQSINQTNESLKKKEREFDIDIDLLLTQSARQYEAKILKVGYDPMSLLIIPPGTADFEAFGHCPNECTSQLIPKRRPIKIFGVSFDTGQKGKGASLHHFRNSFEIPLILENRNHDPAFQQMQLLHLETPIRPGDQVTVRCKFGKPNHSAEPSSQTASSSSISPRCLAYLWYYQENGNSSSNINSTQNLDYECTSKIHPSDLYRWIEENAPRGLKRGTDFHKLLQSKLTKLRWTPFLRLSMFELYEFGRYRASCGVPSSTSQAQSHNKTRTNNNRNRSNAFQNYRSRNSNGTSPNSRTNTSSSSPRNGKNRAPVTSPTRPTSSTAAASTASEITVHPLPVEDMPYSLECPSLDDDGHGEAAAAGRPLLFAPLPGPVIFGFP